MIFKIKPAQDFKYQGHYTKVKLRSYHDIAHLHPLLMLLPSIIFKHLTVFKIQPGQDIAGLGLYSKVKGKTLCTPTPPTNVPTKYKTPTPHSFWNTTSFLSTVRLLPMLDGMGHNNTHDLWRLWCDNQIVKERNGEELQFTFSCKVDSLAQRVFDLIFVVGLKPSKSCKNRRNKNI